MKSKNPSEHEIQKSIFEWCEWQKPRIPELGHLFAIPNGGKRHIVVAKKMKAEGQQAGILDTFLPIPNKKYHGLFMEVKRPGGKLSEAQSVWISKLESYNYMCAVVKSLEEAQHVLLTYIGDI